MIDPYENEIIDHTMEEAGKYICFFFTLAITFLLVVKTFGLEDCTGEDLIRYLSRKESAHRLHYSVDEEEENRHIRNSYYLYQMRPKLW